MNGVIIINKPANYTSRDIVNIASKKLNTKKIGHTGTLDPMATGVLVLTIGRATKISELLTNYDKEYIAEFTFGILTDTLDSEGTILKEQDCIINEEQIKQALKTMTKTYYQEVPIYSAVKINGKKLYEYARNNEEIELPKHKVTIHSLELLDMKYKDNRTIITIRCSVTKGTYIRALAHDLGHSLNTYGIMSSLKRTKQGNFTIEQAISIDDVNTTSNLISITESLKQYKTVIANSELKTKLKNGAIIENKYNASEILFVDDNNEALCLYRTYENNQLKPWKMFKTN